MNPDKINALIDHWCPQFSRESEPRENQIVRAFLAATSCARVQAEIAAGNTGSAALLAIFPDPLFSP